MPQTTEVLDKISRLMFVASILLCVTLLGVIIMLLGTAYGIHHSNVQLKKSVEHSNQLLACYVRDQFKRSMKGLPANAYYKAHPDELATALQGIIDQREKAVATWGRCRTRETT